MGCGRRVAKLYSSGIFACRQYLDLAYDSQRENLDDRATRRAEKIRERLGWEQGILNDGFGKPPNMHWRTYYRLQDEHDRLVEISVGQLMKRIEKYR